MINITFNLHKRDKTATHGRILCVLHIEGEKKTINTKLRVPAKFWDPKKHKLKKNGEIDYQLINRNIERFKDRLQKLYLDIEYNEGVVTVDNLLKAYNETQEVKKVTAFMPYVDNHWQSLKENKQKNWRSYKTTYNLLARYCKDKRKTLNWDDINIDFYDSYTVWFYKQKDERTGRYLAKNYLGTQIRNIKAIMTAAWERDLHTNQKYKVKGFKKQQENVYNVYYDLTELEKIHRYHFKEKRLEHTKDRFLIGCFTGLRFSDLSELGGYNITNGYIIQDTSKTEVQVTIPIHWIVQDILNKYDGEFPDDISNQKMNAYIKEVMKKIGFNKMILKYRTEGGERVRHVIPKWKLTTTHTMRRSLASNMYLAGIPLEDIMPITGHKKAAQLLEYIKVEGLRRAQKIEKSPFFQRPTITLPDDSPQEQKQASPGA